jgi:hypothetical protein
MEMTESLQFFKKLPGRGGGLHFESDYDVINDPQLQSFPSEIRGEAYPSGEVHLVGFGIFNSC